MEPAKGKKVANLDPATIEPTSPIMESPVNIPYIQEVMRDYFNDDNCIVRTITSSRAMNIGDNCIADVYRVKITGVRKENNKDIKFRKHVVVKKPINDDVNTPSEIFKYETLVYKNVLKKLEVAYGEQLPVIRSIHVKPNVVITEDFLDDNWVLPKRRVGINQDQCIQVIRSLARFHSASIILSKMNEKKFKKLLNFVQDHVYSDYTEDVCKKTVADAHTVGKCFARKALVKATPEEASGLKRMFKYSSDLMYVRAKIATNSTPDFAKVLVHGNCWANNFMLKEDNSVDHALLINISTVCLTTPARDLVYLFATNPQIVDKTLLIHIYVEELHTHLNRRDIPSEVIEQFSFKFIESEVKRLVVVARLTGLWLLLPISYVTFPTVEEYNGTKRRDLAELVAKHVDKQFYTRRLIDICVEYA